VTFDELVTIASDAGPLIALALLAWVLKAWMDARLRAKLAASNNSEDLIRTILANDRDTRRFSPLRWGMVLAGLAGGLAIIEAVGWREPTPGVFAILLGATGLGNLAAFAVTRWLMSRRDDE
jgi:hypothetical protein